MKKLLSFLLSMVVVLTSFSTIQVFADEDYSDETSTTTSEVTAEALKVTVNKTNMHICADGLSNKINYKVESGTVNKVSYKSSNPKVISVDSNGSVIAKSFGTATITITFNGVYQKKVKVYADTMNYLVLTGSTRKYPTINKKEYKSWTSSKKANVSVKAKEFKGVKNKSTAVLTKKVGGVTYKLNVYVVNKADLNKRALKDLGKIVGCSTKGSTVKKVYVKANGSIYVDISFKYKKSYYVVNSIYRYSKSKGLYLYSCNA